MKYTLIKRHLFITWCFIIFTPLQIMCQTEIIAFHNCENFFYPTNDSLTKDDDFTFESPRNWSFARFNKKKNDLAKTYISLGKGNLPAIIGLCEIENKEVLRSLCFDSPLRKGGYDFIHYDSEDIRGIDVALIYRKDRFKVLKQENISVDKSFIKDEPTRDILYVKGLLNNMHLHLFIVHAPSRRNKDKNKQLRKAIFNLVYEKASALYKNGEKNIIIMGDMNDNPWDKTTQECFHLKQLSLNAPILINLMMFNRNKTGSYVFANKEESFDQFITTNQIKGLLVKGKNTNFVFKEDFLIDKNPLQQVPTPFSTYKGFQYQGGISDHFPIYLEINTH